MVVVLPEKSQPRASVVRYGMEEGGDKKGFCNPPFFISPWCNDGLQLLQ